MLRRLVAGADLAALLLAGAVAFEAATLIVHRMPQAGDVLIYLVLLPLWTYIASLLRLYHLQDRSFDLSSLDEIGPIALAATTWSWFFLLSRAALESGPIQVFLSMALWLAMIVAIPACRSLVRTYARGRPWYRQRVAIVGVPADIGRVARRIGRHPEYGLDLALELQIDPPNGDANGGEVGASACTDAGRLGITESGEALQGLASASLNRGGRFTPRLVGAPEELAEIVASREIGRVIVASSLGDLETRGRVVRRLVAENVHVDLVSGESDALSNGSSFHYLEGLPVVSVPSNRPIRAWAALKRLLDLLVGAVALFIFAPALAFLAIWIRRDSSGPILFRQTRIGREGRCFELLKFRTMVDNADALKRRMDELNMHSRGPTPGMFKVPGDPRITRPGRWLRRWSLDELPQLWNVLRGDMSLVGPRPLIPEEAEQVRGHYSVRLNMSPGITGPWQTLGRSEIGFGDMVKLDYTYVSNWSFAEDLRLLLRTIAAVARGRGAY